MEHGASHLRFRKQYDFPVTSVQHHPAAAQLKLMLLDHLFIFSAAFVLLLGGTLYHKQAMHLPVPKVCRSFLRNFFVAFETLLCIRHNSCCQNVLDSSQQQQAVKEGGRLLHYLLGLKQRRNAQETSFVISVLLICVIC